MSASLPAAMFVYERNGRWAASLRRHGLVERLQLVETRSLEELRERARATTRPLVALEITAATVEGVLQWLSRWPGRIGVKAAIVFAQRGLRVYELACREAGAVLFIDSELELFSLGAVIDRYLSEGAFAKLDAEELPLAERIRASLPW